MRDVVWTKETRRKRKTLIRPDGSVSYSYTSQSNCTNARSQRANVFKTTPNEAGIYTDPSPYEAFFSIVSPEPYQVSYKIHQWPYNGVYWNYLEAPDPGYRSISDRDIYRYGCDAVTLHPVIPNEVIQRAREKVYRELRDGAFDLGTMIGELKETFTGLRSLLLNAQALGAALKGSHGLLSIPDVRNMALRDARRQLPRNLSKRYLEYMYGIRPIMQSIYDILEDSRQIFERPDMIRVKADQLDGAFRPQDFVGSFTPAQRWCSGTAKRGYEVSVVLKLEHPEVFDLWRYGLLSPLAVAWELISLSFVIDWFSHIGGFLNTLFGPLGIIFKDGYETAFMEFDVTYGEFIPPWNDPNVVLLSDPYARVRIHTTAMRRYEIFSVPAVKPYFTTGIDYSQLITIITLLFVKA